MPELLTLEITGGVVSTEGIVAETSFEKALISPDLPYALTAKYHVPGVNSDTVQVVAFPASFTLL